MQVTVMFRNGIRHPRIKVLQYPWISVLIDREACTGVKTRQVQNGLFKARAADPGV
jgi:hypothetical protein